MTPIRNARDLLTAALTPGGFLAGLVDTSNYRRIWARDGVIAGLAGLLTDADAYSGGLRATLETLARAQGPHGQIPSNVLLGEDGEVREVSYGKVAGRVDTVPWFVIGVCNLVKTNGDEAFLKQMTPVMRRAMELLSVWEYNGRGLLYVPLGGDWADEYVLHGYVLFDQLLRLWAARCLAALLNEAEFKASADRLADSIRLNYRPMEAHREHPDLYHPWGYRVQLRRHGERPFWLAALGPGGYDNRFDALSNSLAVLLDLGDADQCRALLDHGAGLAEETALGLLPAFWPPIRPEDPEWSVLQSHSRDSFSNHPYCYHNGGVWPMVNGWWGKALVRAGRRKEAEKLLAATVDFNKQNKSGKDPGFYEYGHSRTGEPMGIPTCTWSAAGELLLNAALQGKSLFFG
ncbi:MAG: glycoside hydrolase 100 family protein [Acidobacteriota bacterium]|nr:glycoside hydrolase 100 family protein [Acidobacteriota bacterium]